MASWAIRRCASRCRAFLKDAAKLLRATGQGRKLDELVTAMNRAAQLAVPMAKPLFVSTVKAMSVKDPLKVVRGGATSVTDYLTPSVLEPLLLQRVTVRKSALPAVPT